MKKWTLLIVAILSEVTATLALKAAVETPAWLALSLVGYVVAFYCLGIVLKHGLSIGVAYGNWAAAGVSLTAILATLIYSEPLTLQIAIGIAVIIAGVLFVEMGSGHSPKKETK